MNALDIWLFSHINANTTTSIWLLEAARSITAHLPTLALVGLTPMLFMESRYRRILFGVIMSMALAWMAARGIREFIPSSRPFALGFGIQGIGHAETASFPSMHATIAGAWATSLCTFSPVERRIWWAAVAIPIALLIAWSRVFLGLHFPSDIIAGLILGLASTLIAFKIISSERKPNKNRKPPIESNQLQ